MSKIVVTSGYFNPLHKGHLNLFKNARRLADSDGPGSLFIVIVNNDKQVKLKGSKKFMNEKERLELVRAIRYVDAAVLSTDTDGTVKNTLKALMPDCFVKGGDSKPTNTPELELCKKLGITILFNVGGDKVQSSSKLKNEKTRRNHKLRIQVR